MKHNTAIEMIKNWPKDQVWKDLEALLDNYFGDRAIGLRKISEQTNISKKTLSRILKKDSKPNQQSVLRFYKYFFSIADDVDLSVQHQWIKEYFLGVISSHYGNINSHLESLLESDIVFRKIYIRLSMGEVSKRQVKELFGDYGTQVISTMKDLGLLTIKNENIFQLKNNTRISKSPTALKKMISELNEDFLDIDSLSEVNKNSAFYFCENVSPEAYETLLNVAEELKKTVRKILKSKDAKGEIPFFMTNVIDQMMEK
ncbi:MAG: hypothetical protein CME61_04875 [Halobacteriovoraceae bacterium]|nr:hypothetical protein [Halobacteriovoraceae bacterium]